MRGYDYKPLNKAFEKHAFKISVLSRKTTDDCMVLLKRGYSLELRQPVLEKLEVYLIDRILREESEALAEGRESRFNENRISYYLSSIVFRRRLSLVQIQTAIRFIDHFFDKAITPGSR